MSTKRLVIVVPLLAALLSGAPAAFAARPQAIQPAAAAVTAAATAIQRAKEPQTIDVAVTSAGFIPSRTNVKVGQPVTLRITRKVERTCATDVVIAQYGIRRALPLNETVEVTFTPTKPGKVRFACAMDMIAGEFVAQ